MVHEPSGIMLRSSASPCPTACAGSAASRSRCGAGGRPGGSGTTKSGPVRLTIPAQRPGGVRRCSTPNASSTGGDLGVGGGLVAGDSRHVSASTRHRLMPRSRAAAITSSARPGTAEHGVEVGVVHQRIGPARSDGLGVTVHALGDRHQAVRAVIRGVHRGDDGQQHLRGADVGRRLLTADVLLTGLQRQAVGRLPSASTGDPDQAAGQLAGQPVGTAR
jgi:hypothetical protein